MGDCWITLIYFPYTAEKKKKDEWNRHCVIPSIWHSIILYVAKRSDCRYKEEEEKNRWQVL